MADEKEAKEADKFLEYTLNFKPQPKPYYFICKGSDGIDFEIESNWNYLERGGEIYGFINILRPYNPDVE